MIIVCYDDQEGNISTEPPPDPVTIEGAAVGEPDGENDITVTVQFRWEE